MILAVGNKLNGTRTAPARQNGSQMRHPCLSLLRNNSRKLRHFHSHERSKRGGAASICFRVVTSVAHQSDAFGPSSGYHFASGSPPMIFSSSKFRIHVLCGPAQVQHELMETRRSVEQHLTLVLASSARR